MKLPSFQQPDHSLRRPRRSDLRCATASARGFTLIELMIAIVIGAILLAIGVPSVREMILNQTVKGAANDFYSDLAFARSEAIKRNAQIVIEQQSGGWVNGWSVKSGANTLRTQSAFDSNHMSYSGATATSVTFNADGRTTLGSNTSFNFSSASSGPVSMRCVVVTPSGRPAVLIDSNRNGNCQDG